MLLGLDETYLKEKKGYHSCFEITRQPLLWESIVENVDKNYSKIIEFLSLIDVENSEIILSGAGSSGLAAKTIENYLSSNKKLNIKAVNSTELLLKKENYINKGKKNVVLVSFSSSGSTPETVEVVNLFKENIENLYQILIIAVSDGIIVKENLNDENVLYIPLPENTKGKSFAATAEYTCLVLQALCILDIKNIEYYKKFVKYAKMAAQDLFDNKMDLIEDIVSFDSVSLTAIGSLEFEVLAQESALKAVEFTAGRWLSNFNSSLEFRHGPKLIMNSPVVSLHFLYPDDFIYNYDFDMMKEIDTDNNKGITIAVGTKPKQSLNYDLKYYFEFDESYVKEIPVLTTLLYALVMHIIIVRVSLKLGIEADWPSTDDQVPKVANRVNIYR